MNTQLSHMSVEYPQKISINASLPFHTKLNIRIRPNRERSDENRVQATATVRRLDVNDEYQYQNHLKHMSAVSFWSNPIVHVDETPDQRKIILPVSLQNDQRILLYVRNGEVLARC